MSELPAINDNDVALLRKLLLNSVQALSAGATSNSVQEEIASSVAATAGVFPGNGAYADSFSRLRVSNPTGLFDAQFTYDLQPLKFEAITAETGVTIAHDADNRCATLTFASTPIGGKAYMQSYEYIHYQPGKSQLIFVTFNMRGGVAGVIKFAGYGDDNNSIEFRLNGTTKEFMINSATDEEDGTVPQSLWNIDKLDGSGASGITLDPEKTQILVIDLQALYVGRVRIGFDIDGMIYYAHEFKHANNFAAPYIQSASLPIRCGMTALVESSTTMDFICCTVISEGGQEDSGGITFTKSATVTAGSGTDTHILSIRPKATFNGIVNRVRLIPESIDITVTGTNPVEWKLVAGQALTNPTFADINTAYSATEALAGAGTLSGSPAIVLQSGYCPATNTVKGVSSPKISSIIPITLNAAGAVRDLGTLMILVQGIGGTSATRAILNWRELR